MMVALHKSSQEPLTEDALLSWHAMLMRGANIAEIGQYRTGSETMQIISGNAMRPKVHFEAPPSSRIPVEMARFVEWFNRTAAIGASPLPALTRAGIAHLYFESIHPFEDGNGRIGRALTEKALAQSLGQPTLTSIAATVLSRRKEYYAALQEASGGLEITSWLAWMAGAAIESQRRSVALAEFLIDRTRLLERLRGQINERQEKALMRLFAEGPSGFQGGLSAGKYGSMTGASPATATRDLADLVEKGALTRTGELKHARYHLAVPNRHTSRVTISDQGEVVSG